MKGVPEVLQLAVIIERRRPPSVEPQPLEKLDFLLGGIAAEGGILEELFQTWLTLDNRLRLLFYILESLDSLEGQPAVQHDFYAKGFEVDVPRLDQRIEKRDAIFDRYMEDICIQKLENHHPHFLIASLAQPGYQTQPVFTFQFFFGDSLGHIQKLLCDQAFELAEGFFLKDHADLPALGRRTFAEDQFAKFMKQGCRRFGHLFPERFLALNGRQLRQFTAF